MKNNKTKALREGAMMVALTAVLILATRFVPFFSIIGTFACGIPLAALAARNGFKVTIPAIIAIFAVTVLITGDVLSALSVILMSVLPGGIAGYTLGKRCSFFTVLFSTCVTVCIGWLAELLIVDLFFAGGIDEMLAQTMSGSKAMLEAMMQPMAESGALAGDIPADEFVGMILKESEKLIRLYMPSFIVVISMVEGYMIMRLCGFVINRAKLAQVKIVPFSEIKAPPSMCTIALVSYVIYIFSGTGTVVGSVIANLVFILYTIIGACGFSVIDFKFKAKIKSAWARFGIYTAIFIFGGILMMYIILGLIIVGILDSRRDFRELGSAGE